MSAMMKEDASYFHDLVVNKSKRELYKELTCMVMKSSHYIKSLPEVDYLQLASKKVNLPKNCKKLESKGLNQKGELKGDT